MYPNTIQDNEDDIRDDYRNKNYCRSNLLAEEGPLLLAAPPDILEARTGSLLEPERTGTVAEAVAAAAAAARIPLCKGSRALRLYRSSARGRRQKADFASEVGIGLFPKEDEICVIAENGKLACCRFFLTGDGCWNWNPAAAGAGA